MLQNSGQYEFGEEVLVCMSRGFGQYSSRWERRRFAGMIVYSNRPYLCFNLNSNNHFTAYARIKKIKPKIEINVRINGKAAKLSDISEETLQKILECYHTTKNSGQ